MRVLKYIYIGDIMIDLRFWNYPKYRYGILGGLILIFTILAFWVRILPFPDLVGTGDMIAGPDAWYNLRLLEAALANGGFGYIFFEPMTLYPTGQDIVWGPLFTWIVAIFAMAAGAATRVEVIDAAAWVPVLMGTAMVPIMYGIGTKIGDWKTGLLSALFIAVIGGQYLSRSLYGHFDHHIAETLFSTLFCLCYILALYSLKDAKIDLKNYTTLKIPIIYGIICGVAHILGLMTMTTMVFFALFIAIFTFIQFIFDHRSGKPTEYLLILNVVTFGVSAIGLLLYGIRDMGFYYAYYSLGLFLAYIALILGTIVLYAFSRIIKIKGKEWYYFPILTIVSLILVVGIIAVIIPEFYSTAIGSLIQVFASSPGQSTIAEMASWSFDGAFSSFNWGLLLAIAGLIYLIYRIWKHEDPASLFVVIWSVLMIFATIQHVRWEYYVAANIALLAAVFVAFVFSLAEKDILQLLKTKTNSAETPKENEKPVKRSGKNTGKTSAKTSSEPDWIKIGSFAIVALIAIAFVGISSVTAFETGSVYGKYGGTEKDWISETTWMLTGTPYPGVDYLTLYDSETFEYPPESYGVMSWWDYGHYITTIAQRIPNSNPFQAGVAGEYGAAAVLVSSDEAEVMEKLDHLGTRYVMTDYQMAGGKFGAMAIWDDSVAQLDPYYYVLIQQNLGQASLVQLYSPEYYNTLTVKLQYYDGSMTEPGNLAVAFTEMKAGYNYPVITSVNAYTNYAEAKAAADQYNSMGSSGNHAYLVSDHQGDTAKSLLPSVTVPALQHFRLVHESPNYVTPLAGQYNTVPTEGSTAWVKSFEYVKGAVIKGEGVIEVPVVTNNGRTFTYRQESVDGQFIVPYSTADNPYEVKTIGPYTIVGTGQTFQVSEDAVMHGLSIN